MTLFPRMKQLLDEQGASDIVLFGGGTIPDEDIKPLLDAGIAAVFTPGTPIATTIDFVRKACGKRIEA
jgi:methylmalonyl-CoA mutase C-terminal domain/subunit